MLQTTERQQTDDRWTGDSKRSRSLKNNQLKAPADSVRNYANRRHSSNRRSEEPAVSKFL